LSYTLHREAEADLLEAARYYRRQGGPMLAARFLDEFERVTTLLQQFPGIGTPAGANRRAHALQDFPYSVIYRQTAGGDLRILVVRHQRRDPAYGQPRR
jgi:plasmid stabilization system protein ParE